MATAPDAEVPAMTEDWDEHARLWDRDEDARLYADRAWASLLEHVDLHDAVWKQRRVLDFGCGTGLLTERIAPQVQEVVAVDIAAAMLGVLRDKRLGNVSIHRADIDDDAVRSAASWLGGFDLIVASNVCAFLPCYPSTLAVLAEALNPGGHLVQWDWLLRDEDDPEQEDGLTLGSVAAAFEHAGLRRIQIAPSFVVLFGTEPCAVLIGAARKTAVATTT